jgi:hypothetical protein
MKVASASVSLSSVSTHRPHCVLLVAAGALRFAVVFLGFVGRATIACTGWSY